MRAMTRTTLRFLQRIRSRPFGDKDLHAPAIVFAPHQDDETLGCGGTILRKTEAGADVSVVYLTDGSGSHPQLMAGETLAETRTAEALAATQMLGIAEQDVIFIGARDGALAEYAKSVTPVLQKILTERRPEQIFVPYARDRLPDHVATHTLVLDAARLASVPVTVFEYPIWFWNHWPWMKQTTGSTTSRIRQFARESLALLSDFNTHVPIGAALTTKRAALDCHRTQMTNFDGSGEWATLNDVADGDFLRCLLRDNELFHRWSLR